MISYAIFCFALTTPKWFDSGGTHYLSTPKKSHHVTLIEEIFFSVFFSVFICVRSSFLAWWGYHVEDGEAPCRLFCICRWNRTRSTRPSTMSAEDAVRDRDVLPAEDEETRDEVEAGNDAALLVCIVDL